MGPGHSLRLLLQLLHNQETLLPFKTLSSSPTVFAVTLQEFLPAPLPEEASQAHLTQHLLPFPQKPSTELRGQTGSQPPGESVGLSSQPCRLPGPPSPKRWGPSERKAPVASHSWLSTYEEGGGLNTTL